MWSLVTVEAAEGESTFNLINNWKQVSYISPHWGRRPFK